MSCRSLLSILEGGSWGVARSFALLFGFGNTLSFQWPFWWTRFRGNFSCTHWASWIWNTYCLASLLSMTREVKERSWCDTRECNNLEGFLMWCSGKPCNASYIGTQRESTQGKNKGRERTLYIHIYIYICIYIYTLLTSTECFLFLFSLTLFLNAAFLLPLSFLFSLTLFSRLSFLFSLTFFSRLSLFSSAFSLKLFSCLSLFSSV